MGPYLAKYSLELWSMGPQVHVVLCCFCLRLFPVGEEFEAKNTAERVIYDPVSSGMLMWNFSLPESSDSELTCKLPG